MSYAYDVHSLIYEAATESSEQTRQACSASGDGCMPYGELLVLMRKKLTDEHTEELRQAVEDKNAAEKIRGMVSKYLYQLKVRVEGMDNQADVVDRLYDDMLGFSFLTDLLQDEAVEEINCNRWDDVEIITAKGYEKIEKKFLSPSQAQDIARRMAQLGGVVVDGAEPLGDSYITKGTRIFVALPPVIDDEAGVFFSIRRQKNRVFSTDDLLRTDTASREELDFLRLCVAHGVSVGFVGETGSGKTADIAYLLDSLPEALRIGSIEDSRELNLTKYTESSRVVSRAVQFKTRLSENPRHHVDARKLVRSSLRVNPDVIAMSEMRGPEAMDVQEAGRTGHTIVTTFHASSARDAYFRYMSMCMQAMPNFSESMLYRFCCQSLPIVVFKKRLRDGTRKYMEIVEAVEQPDGTYQIVKLFEYVVTANEHDGSGNTTTVHGYHTSTKNRISAALAHMLLNNGADRKEIQQFAGDDWMEGMEHAT